MVKVIVGMPLPFTGKPKRGVLKAIREACRGYDSKVFLSQNTEEEAKIIDPIVRISLNLNRCIEEALRQECSHLWIVEWDVIVPKDALEKLLNCEADLASGCVPFKIPEWIIAGFFTEGDRTRWLRKEELTGEIYGGSVVAGTGCLLIARRVLEALKFEGSMRIRGHEVDYFLRAQLAGFISKIHTGILCKHLKI